MVSCLFAEVKIFHFLAKHHSQGFKRFCSSKESLTKRKEAKREQSVHLWLWGTEMEWQVSIIVNVQKTIIGLCNVYPLDMCVSVTLVVIVPIIIIIILH